jgi:hypothetical protein
VRSLSCQRKVGERFVPELDVLMLRHSRMTLKHVTWILVVTGFLRFVYEPDSVQHTSKVRRLWLPCIATGVATHLLVKCSRAGIRVNRVKITKFSGTISAPITVLVPEMSVTFNQRKHLITCKGYINFSRFEGVRSYARCVWFRCRYFPGSIRCTFSICRSIRCTFSICHEGKNLKLSL